MVTDAMHVVQPFLQLHDEPRVCFSRGSSSRLCGCTSLLPISGISSARWKRSLQLRVRAYHRIFGPVSCCVRWGSQCHGGHLSAMRVVLPRLSNLHEVLGDVLAARLQEWLGFFLCFEQSFVMSQFYSTQQLEIEALTPSHRISSSVSWLVETCRWVTSLTTVASARRAPWIRAMLQELSSLRRSPLLPLSASHHPSSVIHHPSFIFIFIFIFDAMLPFVCDTAEQLASEVPKLLGIVELAFAMKGFSLDLPSGKTEDTFVLRGPGKPRAMATIAHDDGTYFEVRDRRLRVVQDYVHMGAVVTASTAMTKTVRRRLQKKPTERVRRWTHPFSRQVQSQ